MKIHFNHNGKGELSNGELLQNEPFEVEISDIDIPLLSMVWLLFKFMPVLE